MIKADPHWAIGHRTYLCLHIVTNTCPDNAKLWLNTEIDWPVTKSHQPHTPREQTPVDTLRDMVISLLQIYKMDRLLDRLDLLHLLIPLRGYRAGSVFHGQDENHIVSLESEVHQQPNSSGENFSGKLRSVIPLVVGTHPLVPLLNWGTHLSLPLQRHGPRCPCIVGESRPGQPYNT